MGVIAIQRHQKAGVAADGIHGLILSAALVDEREGLLGSQHAHARSVSLKGGALRPIDLRGLGLFGHQPGDNFTALADGDFFSRFDPAQDATVLVAEFPNGGRFHVLQICSEAVVCQSEGGAAATVFEEEASRHLSPRPAEAASGHPRVAALVRVWPGTTASRRRLQWAIPTRCQAT